MLVARLWFARLIMLYAFVLFLFLAWTFILEPLEHIERFGISASGTPESINFVRTSLGALFLGLTITAGLGLARPKFFRTALWMLILFDGCIVSLRLFGMSVDGVTPLQLTELRDEGLSWLLFVAALVAHPRV